jgi:hypothetical protein
MRQKMAGRKSKLTEEMTQVICENIELGLSYNLTCQAAGITFETFNDWMKAGAAAERGSLAGDMWLLERRYAADYGRKDHLNMKAQTEALNYNVDIPENEIEKRRSQILKGILGDIETEPVEEDSSESFSL